MTTTNPSFRNLAVSIVGSMLLVTGAVLPGCESAPATAANEASPATASSGISNTPTADPSGAREPAQASAAPSDPPPPPLGTRQNPVRCDDVAGQIDYLQRLRTASGEPVTYERMGVFGYGPGGHFLDAYRVIDPKQGTEAIIYMDLYHPGYVEREPVPGFELAESP